MGRTIEEVTDGHTETHILSSAFDLRLLARAKVKISEIAADNLKTVNDERCCGTPHCHHLTKLESG